MKVAIIGAGHGGCALAAHLTQLSQQVTLYADAEHVGYLPNIKHNKLSLTGEITGEVVIYRQTTDIKAAITSAEVIYLALPTFAHLLQFKKMLPYLQKGQMILTLAGNFSSAYFYKELCKHGKQDLVYVAGLASLPYACRLQDTGEIEIIAVKKSMEIAAMPACNTDIVINKIKDHFPTKLIKSEHLIALGLNITSAISHPTIMLLNAGRIGKDQTDFYFYKEGISKDIVRVIAQIDQDRQAIASKYGLKLPSYLASMNAFYNTNFTSYYEFFTESAVHNKLRLCPSSVGERYLSQDVPYVMLPWYLLGAKAGFESCSMRSIIDLASLLNNTNYKEAGRCIVQDIFNGLEVGEILQLVRYGAPIKKKVYLEAA